MTNLQRRLLLVEDEMLMSALLADSLKNANFAVETAADAAAARKAIKTFDPDIMLIDIFLGSGPNGIQLANAVSQTNPEIGLLILTKYQDSLSSANDLGSFPRIAVSSEKTWFRTPPTW